MNDRKVDCMLALQIQDVKTFMSGLLVHTMFDRFLLYEMDITMANSFHMNGLINREWYSTDELEQMNDRTYAKWTEMKPIAYELIKGKKTPTAFKIIFMLDEDDLIQLARSCGEQYNHETIQSMLFNVKYEKNVLTIITGTSMKTFTLDKTLEQQWDQTMINFLRKQKIAFEQL